MQLNSLKHNAWVNPLVSPKEKYNTQQLPEKFVNLLMKNGDKLKAYKIFYNTLKILYKNYLSNQIKTKKNIDFYGLHTPNSNKPIYKTCSRTSSKKLFFKAIENVKPSVEVRGVKISGKTYQVPAVIYTKRQQILAVRWILDSARKKKRNSSISFAECLASELLEAVNKRGKSRQNRDDLHKLAESNRAYMRFKWW